jgi:hypothetical protein
MRANKLSANVSGRFIPLLVDGVVAHKHMLSKRILNLGSVSDQPVRFFKGRFAASSRCRVHPSSRGREYAQAGPWQFIHTFFMKRVPTHV